MASNLIWDVFISHASEDKIKYVAPLARALQALGVRVWYDEFTLKLGDSLSRSIDSGLAQSKFGIVVISKSFIAKRWPEYELRGLVAKEIATEKTILPIWLDVSHDDIISFSPPLADKFSINADHDSVETIAIRIVEVIRPDLFTRILRRAAFLKAMESAEVFSSDPKTVKPSPIRHSTLPSALIGRIRLIRSALLEVYPRSMEFWLDGFMRDAHPSKEIGLWERLSAVYLEYVNASKVKNLHDKESIFKALFGIWISASNVDEILKGSGNSEDDIYKMRRMIFESLPSDKLTEPDVIEELNNLTEEDSKK